MRTRINYLAGLVFCVCAFNFSEVIADHGNIYNYRMADASYTNFWLVAEYNHGGVVSDVSSSGDNYSKIYEMSKTDHSGNCIEYNTMASHKSGKTWYGSYSPTGDITDSQRQSIKNTAVELYNRGNVGYTWANALECVSSPGTYISPSEVVKLRCDGLVEYCYEWNNISGELNVWGKSGTNYDISVYSNLGEHNNFDQPPLDPDIRLSPYAQRGGHSSNAPSTTFRCSDDYYEQNDTRTTAHDLSSRPGQWLYLGRAYQFDNDWYRIYVSDNGYRRIYIQCNLTHSQGDIDIELVNSSGTVLAASTSSTDNEYIDYTVPSTGYYYIRAYYGNQGNSYNIYWDRYATPSYTLTLYVHEDSVTGPILVGASVTGTDGAGVSFNKTTNSSGYVTITGATGSWQFTASKSGYQTTSWSQDITTTCERHAFLTRETTPPTVTITSPTSNPTYSTSSSPLSIGGTASDNVEVTQVTWSNDRGGSGTCSGTTSWSASGITLYSGQNVITVTARDAANNTGTDTLTVTYTPPCSVTTPTMPSGPASGQTGQSLSYSTGGSTCSNGHSVQYRFDWGDGSYSSWGSSTQSYTYTSTNTYTIKAQARCISTLTESSWSSGKSVTISLPPCSVTTPTTPSGPSSGQTGQSLSYSTGGSTCSNGHSVQYRFDWGDGSGYSSWGSLTQSHTYSSANTYTVKAQARCASTFIESSWSSGISVTIIQEQILLSPMTADLNHDGIPNFYDFSYFAMFWQNASCSEPNWCDGSDFDKNEIVDIYDLQIFAEFWLWPVVDVDMDGAVNFTDYAIFADNWMDDTCCDPNWCEGTDFDHSGSVDMLDLATFTEYWLEGI